MNIYCQKNLFGEYEFHVPDYFSLTQSGTSVTFDFDSPSILGFPAYDVLGEGKDIEGKLEFPESGLEKFINLCDAGDIEGMMQEAINIFDNAVDELEDASEWVETRRGGGLELEGALV